MKQEIKHENFMQAERKKTFLKRDSYELENTQIFNTLNYSESEPKYVDKTPVCDKEKIIERFICNIENKNTNNTKYKKNLNNSLLYKNNKQMQKEIKMTNEKIGFNYLHILTMKLKKKQSKSSKKNVFKSD